MEIVFIPGREPWRNGIIERFHREDDQPFWRSRTCRDRPNLAAELPPFGAFHNPQHRSTTWARRTSWEVHSAHRRRRLSSPSTRHCQDRPRREGCGSCLRFIDAWGYVRFVSKSLLVDTVLGTSI
jgi:hypothetical protein